YIHINRQRVLKAIGDKVNRSNPRLCHESAHYLQIHVEVKVRSKVWLINEGEEMSSNLKLHVQILSTIYF
ncbi:unnamed protein product, partial [Arabidopsis halleri]